MHAFPPRVLGSFALRRPVVFEVPSSPLPLVSLVDEQAPRASVAAARAATAMVRRVRRCTRFPHEVDERAPLYFVRARPHRQDRDGRARTGVDLGRG